MKDESGALFELKSGEFKVDRTFGGDEAVFVANGDGSLCHITAPNDKQSARALLETLKPGQVLILAHKAE